MGAGPRPPDTAGAARQGGAFLSLTRAPPLDDDDDDDAAALSLCYWEYDKLFPAGSHDGTAGRGRSAEDLHDSGL